jgi:ferritin-like metal-binding protein YciE
MAYDIIERKSTVDKRALAGAAILATTATAAMALTTTPKGKEILQKLKERQTPGSKPADIVEEKPLLVSWLNNAHAMEEAQMKALKGVIADFKDDAEMSEALQKHLTQTEKQKDDVSKCLAQLDEKPSKTKEVMGAVAGMMPAIDLKMFKDKKVKGLLTLISGEHFETASYEALAVAAQAEGKKAIANTMTRIAKEEKAMADWLEKQLPKVIKEDLAKDLAAEG